MFYYVEGTVALTEPSLAVIDCGGVGYACSTSRTTSAQLKPGQKPGCIPILLPGGSGADVRLP